MSMKKAAQEIRAQGRGKDTELVHLTKREVDALHGIAALAGGGLTVNPKTGLTEAGFLDSLLPTILGFGATMIGGPMAGAAVGAATGAVQNKENPLMGAVLGGMGGYGGGQFAQGLGSLGSSAVSPDMLMQASNAADPINALAQAKDLATATGVQAPTGLGALQAGFQNTTNNPMGLVNTMGGYADTAKAAGMAAAPMLYDSMMPKAGEPVKKPGDGERREFEYDPGYTGGAMTGADMSSERRWFDPTYTRTMAEGGEVRGYAEGGKMFGAVSRQAQPAPQMIERQVQAKGASGAPAFEFNQSAGTFTPRMETIRERAPMTEEYSSSDGQRSNFLNRFQRETPVMRMLGATTPRWRRGMADGGEVAMESGGFVIPADVVSMAGGGSTDAGLGALAKTMGARPIKGAGDGQSDDIPATVDGQPVARVANGEAYVPRDKVDRLGGAKKLYAMLDRVRNQAQGHTKQQRPVDLKKAMS
jgi:hypothetical protein